MTGEELGIELLRRMAEVQSGKKIKKNSTADITMLSQQLSKEEYDNFYYMSQIGNLIVNLSKQEISYANQFYRWFNGIETAAGDIIRAEKTVEINPGMNDEYLHTLKNFAKDKYTDNISGIRNNYILLHRALRSLLAADCLMKIVIKTYKIPFMKCYLYDIKEIESVFDFLNTKITGLEKYVTAENEDVYKIFQKIEMKDFELDKDMVKLTEKVAFLSHLDSLILKWCSNYEVILNNLMGFELFPNPNWIDSYIKPSGVKYGVFKYPDKNGHYEAEWGGIKWQM